MSKQETLIIKGIAISMMLFLHLFNKESVYQFLTRTANPIFYFVKG